MGSKCSNTNENSSVGQRTDNTMDTCEPYHIRVFKRSVHKWSCTGMRERLAQGVTDCFRIIFSWEEHKMKKSKGRGRGVEERREAGKIERATTEKLFCILIALHLSAIITDTSFPGGACDKEPTCQCWRCKRCGFDPWVGKIPWSRKWQPTPVFLPGESHG